MLHHCDGMAEGVIDGNCGLFDETKVLGVVYADFEIFIIRMGIMKNIKRQKLKCVKKYYYLIRHDNRVEL